MIRVVIIGAGNVAIHLSRAMVDSTRIRLVQIFSRSERNASSLPGSVPRTDDLGALAEADVYLVAVKDDAISALAPALKHLPGLVAHTSGTVSMDALAGVDRRAVFYPVQTFSKDRELDWKSIPLVLETSDPNDMGLLRSLAAELSDSIYVIDSAGRKKLHLAAVFANNFSNHMFRLSKEICLDNELSFDLLRPLILETASKVISMEPEAAQTGPARRKDRKVMSEQEDQLDAEKKEIYSLLSDSIATRYMETD